jgi:metallophosphoesterase (TIGR03767 family)
MSRVSRRTFLRGSTMAAAGAWVWPGAAASAYAQGLASLVNPSGTTLEMTLGLPEGTGYRRLVELPGWPIEVRDDLATPQSGREDRRTALASIVHLTDIHIVDAQATARVEFLDRYADPPSDPIPFSSAWRPQEALCGHIADAMVRRVNQIGAGPVTGRPFDCAVSTGDATDNQALNELEWLLRCLNGGTLRVNSGAEGAFEGVQDDSTEFVGIDLGTNVYTFDDHYWHPDEVVHPGTGDPDRYKRIHGFPTIPGLLDTAVAPFTAQGLNCPWYSCYGNHDGLLQGNAPPVTPLDEIAVGPLKVIGLPAGMSPGDAFTGLVEGDSGVINTLLTGGYTRTVTPDENRRPIDAAEWARHHVEDTGGPGPVGHGFGERAIETGQLYYTFDIGDGILGIVLDTVNPGGYANGSIGQAQLQWLQQELIGASGHYYGAGGEEIATENTDRLVVIFSHHNLNTMDNPFPNIFDPQDTRVLGPEIEALVHRFPNVIAWVNGHSHVNRVWARPDPAGRSGGFWEVNTAAHIDAPQHARLVEVADNHDGTLSIFGTVIDHAGPAAVPHDATDVLSLASLAREFSYNEPQAKTPGSAGGPGDRNVELLIDRPFVPASAGVPGSTDNQQDGTPPLPSTGAGLGAMAGAAALGAAVALRRRGHDAPERHDG